MQVTHGQLVGGGVGDLASANDAYVVVAARRPTVVADASAEIVISGTALQDNPRALQFVLEAGTEGLPTLERIEFWNFDLQRWEVVAERGGTNGDRCKPQAW